MRVSSLVTVTSFTVPKSFIWTSSSLYISASSPNTCNFTNERKNIIPFQPIFSYWNIKNEHSKWRKKESHHFKCILKNAHLEGKKTWLTIPPLAMAMSRRVFFLLSPNPGAFTAQTWSPTFSLPKTNDTCESLNFLKILPKLILYILQLNVKMIVQKWKKKISCISKVKGEGKKHQLEFWCKNVHAQVFTTTVDDQTSCTAQERQINLVIRTIYAQCNLKWQQSVIWGMSNVQ